MVKISDILNVKMRVLIFFTGYKMWPLIWELIKKTDDAPMTLNPRNCHFSSTLKFMFSEVVLFI